MKTVKNELTKKKAADLLGVSSRTVERRLKPVRQETGEHGLVSLYSRGDVLRLAEGLGRSVTPATEVEIVSPHDATSPDTASEQGLARQVDYGPLIAVLERLKVAPADNHATPSISDLAAKPPLKLDEAARFTGLSRNTLRAAIDGGQLRAKIVGRAWRIKQDDLDAYVKKL